MTRYRYQKGKPWLSLSKLRTTNLLPTHPRSSLKCSLRSRLLFNLMTRTKNLLTESKITQMYAQMKRSLLLLYKVPVLCLFRLIRRRRGLLDKGLFLINQLSKYSQTLAVKRGRSNPVLTLDLLLQFRGVYRVIKTHS